MSTIDPTSPVSPSRANSGDSRRTGTKQNEGMHGKETQHDEVAISDTAAKLSAKGSDHPPSTALEAASSVRRIMTTFSLQPGLAFGVQANATHEDVQKLL